MYVCMYVRMVITDSRVWINRVRCQSWSWSAEQGKIIFPCPRASLRIGCRETGSAVPSRVSLLISIIRLNLVLTYRIPPDVKNPARGHKVVKHHHPEGMRKRKWYQKKKKGKKERNTCGYRGACISKDD